MCLRSLGALISFFSLASKKAGVSYLLKNNKPAPPDLWPFSWSAFFVSETFLLFRKSVGLLHFCKVSYIVPSGVALSDVFVAWC